MFKDTFNVTAMCADRYKGTAVVSPCSDDRTPYSLSGCSAESCTEPGAAAMKGYELSPFSLERPSFSVTVKCASGVGFGTALACARDGEPYTVEGCLVGECTSLAAHLAAQGYVVRLSFILKGVILSFRFWCPYCLFGSSMKSKAEV